MKKIIFTLLIVIFLIPTHKIYPQDKQNKEMNLRIYHNPVNPPFISPWDKVSPEIKKRKSFKRYEWFYKPRLNELGIFPKEFIDMQADFEYSKIRFSADNFGNPFYQWVNLGPVGIDLAGSFISYWGINSGRVRGLAIHPTDPNIVYIGAASGGIWKTTNGGANWTDKSGTLNRLTFGCIAIDPSNTQVIYAGTGESRWQLDDHTFEGDGLYKSTDAGETWIKIVTEFDPITQFGDLVVSPHNSNILLAALGSGNENLPTPTNQGIWRSSNAGLNWDKVINTTGAFDVEFHPTDQSVVYAATGNQQSQGGFHKSTDGGLTFVQYNNGLPSTDQIGRIQFSLAQSNPSIMYCVIYNSSPITGGRKTCAYKTTNAGDSWFQISNGVNIAGTYNGTTVDDQGSYDLCITVNPANPDNIFLGNVEMSKSYDGSSISFLRNPAGYTGGNGAWDGYVHVDVHIIKFAPSNPSIVYVGCDGGIYKSLNGGQTFSHVNNGINTIQFYRVASHPTDPNKLFGGAQDNGAFETINKGTTPWIFKQSGDGMECFYDYSNSSIIFSGTQSGALSKSTNGGLNWYEIRSSNSDSNAWCTPYWQHPTNPNVIYGAALYKIIKSTDKGEEWENVSSVITTEAIYSAIQSKPNTNNMMLITNDSRKVYKSSDEGATWTDITANSTLFTGANLMRVQADPVNENTFYITRASYTTAQVLKTTNFGVNWIDISSDLPKITASDIFIDSANTDILFVANDFGVYRSTNGGTNWDRLSQGFPFVPVLDFNLYNYNGVRYLRAATHGRGVYEINIDAISVRDPRQIVYADNYVLYQNYPNPYNAITNISYKITVSQFVNLTVFDILGKEISVLVNENKPAGTYQIKFDSGNLPSGIYYYKLKAGDFSEVKKMVLIK